ncbi:flagellar hook-length control protein FliK [Hoeflea sp.]|uniref:flagellar hook-length control protein FliK n=1 Tax=Hoeflea sp. TaxID=1940281 RepID=UPI003748AB7D
MNALDVIIQRQPPARSPARQNDAGSSGNSGSSDAAPFSEVLSGQQRRSAEKSDRSDAASGKEPAKETDTTGTAGDEETGETSDKDESDEMLALLDGLSAAAKPDVQPAPEAAGKQIEAETLDETDVTDQAEAANKAQGPGQSGTATAAQPNSHVVASDAAARAPSTAAAAAAPVATGAGVSNRVSGADAQQDRADKKSPDAASALRAGGNGSEAGGPARSASEKPLILEGRVGAAAERRQQEERLDGKAQNVEVLESRRFMATQAMGGNAQMLTRSLVDAGQSAQQAQSSAAAQSAANPGQPQSGQMLHTLKLQLNPISLGSVTAVLKLSGEELTVDIKVQTAEAYRQLSDDNQAILKALRGQGFGVEQINIQHVSSADRGSNQNQQQAGFQGGFQDSGSGDAQASGKESGGQGGGNKFGSQADGQGHDQKPHSSPDAGRSDGVYL